MTETIRFRYFDNNDGEWVGLAEIAHEKPSNYRDEFGIEDDPGSTDAAILELYNPDGMEDYPDRHGWLWRELEYAAVNAFFDPPATPIHFPGEVDYVAMNEALDNTLLAKGEAFRQAVNRFIQTILSFFKINKIFR